MAAAPTDASDPGAVPWVPGTPVPDASVEPGLLPDWYMPAPAGTVSLRGWRRIVALAVVGAFLAISAAGLCNTYGDILAAI